MSEITGSLWIGGCPKWSLASPNTSVLGVFMGQRYPSCQGPQPSWTLGSLPQGCGGDAGSADPAGAPLTAVG